MLRNTQFILEHADDRLFHSFEDCILHNTSCGIFTFYLTRSRHRHVLCVTADGGRTRGQEWDHKLEEMQWHSHVLKEFNFHSFKFMTVRHRTIGASVQCLLVCLWVNGSHLYVHCVRLNHVEYSEVQLYPSYIVWSYHLYRSVTLENNSNTGHFQICNYCLWPRKWQKKKNLQ